MVTHILGKLEPNTNVTARYTIPPVPYFTLWMSTLTFLSKMWIPPQRQKYCVGVWFCFTSFSWWWGLFRFGLCPRAQLLLLVSPLLHSSWASGHGHSLCWVELSLDWLGMESAEQGHQNILSARHSERFWWNIHDISVFLPCLFVGWF